VVVVVAVVVVSVHSQWRIKSEHICVPETFHQSRFQKRLALIFAIKCSHVERF